MSDDTITLARFLYRRLVELGVNAIFGLPGDFSLSMLDELEDFDEISWIGASSELGASFAADGYARARGLGVLATTFGVGELGAASGVAGAMAEDVGVLHIVSSPPTAAMRSGALVHHTLADGDNWRFLRVARELTHSQHVVEPDSAVDDIDRALREWVSARRATYLLIPQDLSTLRVSATRLSRPIVADQPNEVKLKQAHDLVARFFKQHPGAVAVAGHLLSRWRCTEFLRSLSERAVRVAELPNSKATVDPSTPGYLGLYNGKLSPDASRAAVEGGDGRVLIGCTLSDTTTGGLSHNFEPESTLIVTHDRLDWGTDHVDGVRFIDLVNLLDAEWPEAAEPSTLLVPNSPLSATEIGTGDCALTQDQLWATIADLLPSGARLFADTGTSHFGALDIALPDNTAFEPSPIWSAIGYSLPAAIGASLGDSSRRVVAVIGDGATQMVAQEFGLIHRTGVNPIVILVNNDGYTVERVIRGPHATYNDIATWNWQIVPRALGVPESSMRIASASRAHSLGIELCRAFADPGRAHFIEVVTDPLDVPPTLATMASILQSKLTHSEKD